MTKNTLFASLLSAAVFATAGWGQGAGQPVSLSEKLQIPGATLEPGSYSFALEDRLPDRAIVRITGGDQHYLLLTVPNAHLSAAGRDRLVLFKSNGGEQGKVLRAWKCQTCSAPLEFVYPKLEAVAITDKTTEPVAAVDPAYDKLPANLSADDMKVVTLWLLAPERITADNVGEGVKAVKYAAAEGNEVAANRAPEPASASADAPPAPVRKKLPKTAGNGFEFALAGLALLASGLGLRLKRAAARAA